MPCFFLFFFALGVPKTLVQSGKTSIHFYEGKPFLNLHCEPVFLGHDPMHIVLQIFFDIFFRGVHLCSGTGEVKLLTMQSLPSPSSSAGRSWHVERSLAYLYLYTVLIYVCVCIYTSNDRPHLATLEYPCATGSNLYQMSYPNTVFNMSRSVDSRIASLDCTSSVLRYGQVYYHGWR